MDPVKNVELVKRLSKGDQDAFSSVFLCYFPKVKSFILHLLKDEKNAEDLSQDIFVKLWENRNSLQSVNYFDAYIYRMAKNAVFNFIKKDSIKNKYVANEYYNFISDVSAVEEEIIAKDIHLLVELTVKKLPARRKEIYEMSRVYGMKNEEIAEKLNISKKTVENHINLALKEIRKTVTLLLMFFF